MCQNSQRACFKVLNTETRTQYLHFRSLWKTWALLQTQTSIALSTAWQLPHIRKEEKSHPLLKASWLWKKNDSWTHQERSKKGVKQIRLHPASCNMEDVIITVAILKWVLFGTVGEGRISCSLASRQRVMSTLIRSVCSTRTHLYCLWYQCASTACSPNLSLMINKNIQHIMDILSDINTMTNQQDWIKKISWCSKAEWAKCFTN